MTERPADRIRKLVALAASGDTPEARNAASKAREAIMRLDTQLLDTLAGQRAMLLEDLRLEHRRLIGSGERATKADTGALIGRALSLLGHYERHDALIAAAMLARIEAGQTLSHKERQQLDGPVEGVLDAWHRASRERRQAERQARRAARRG